MVRTGGRWKRTFRNLASGLPVCVFLRHWKRIQDTKHYTVTPPGFQEYLQHEARAKSAKLFSPTLIHGLLQTEDYARRVFSVNRHLDMVDQLLHDRMGRQEILDKVDHACFVMDENVLARTMGGPETMRAQLEHLLEISQRPNIFLEVIPSSVDVYPCIEGEVHILGFEDGTNIVYTEACAEGILVQDPARVARHVLRYDSLRSYALPVDQSRALIHQAIERLKAC